jgi:hypothetical protein
MERVEAYRRHAAECRLLAENARTGEDRTILLRMAQSWDMLAEELEFTKQVDQLRDSDRQPADGIEPQAPFGPAMTLGNMRERAGASRAAANKRKKPLGIGRAARC